MDPRVARIIDANLNRAREALRVMEEYARFVLDDAAGCQVLKRLRHDLAEAVQGLPADTLLAGRDTPGDVGTRIVTEREQVRADAEAVFTAAAKRLPETLRAIEEYGKTIDAGLASAVEAIRYRAYDVEQRLVMRGELSARFAKVRLYVIVTAGLCRSDWLTTAAQAIAGGAGCLQLREKDLDDRTLIERARQLSALCRERDVLCIVNDRPDVAVAADADGVHLGQTDMALADARRIVGPRRLIGLSTHTPEQLDEAIQAAPDYIAVGPMFASQTKPQDHVPGPALLGQAISETMIPIVPVGGITPENVDMLRKAGAERICACSAVIGAENVQATAGKLAANSQWLRARS